MIFLLMFLFVFLVYFFNNYSVPFGISFTYQILASHFYYKTPLYDPGVQYSRLPLFPLLTGFISMFLPVKFPIIVAGQILSLVFFLLGLILIYLISNKFLGKWSFLVVFLTAFNPASIFISNQPLSHSLLLFTTVLTIYFAVQRSSLAYIAATLATLTSYEGIAILLALLAKDFFINGQRKKAVVYSILALGGLVIWLFLTREYLSENFTLQLIKREQPQGFHFLLRVIDGAIGPFISLEPRVIHQGEFPLYRGVFWFGEVNIFYLIAFILALAGSLSLIRTYSTTFFILPTFFLFYSGMFMVYHVTSFRYFPPILWIFYLIVIAGLLKICAILRQITKQWKHFIILFLAIFAVWMIITMLLNYISRVRLEYSLNLIFILFSSIFLTFNLLNIKDLENEFKLFLIIFSALFLILFLYNIYSIDYTQRIYSHKFENLRMLGEWYGEIATSTDKLLLPIRFAGDLTWVPVHYSKLPLHNFVNQLRLEFDTLEEFIQTIKKENITYVAIGIFSDFDFPEAKLSLEECVSRKKLEYSNVDKCTSLLINQYTHCFKLVKELIPSNPEKKINIYKFIC